MERNPNCHRRGHPAYRDPYRPDQVLPTEPLVAAVAITTIVAKAIVLVVADQGQMVERHLHKILNSQTEAGLGRIGRRENLGVAVDPAVKAVRDSTGARGEALGRFLVPADGVVVTGIAAVIVKGAANTNLLPR